LGKNPAILRGKKGNKKSLNWEGKQKKPPKIQIRPSFGLGNAMKEDGVTGAGNEEASEVGGVEG